MSDPVASLLRPRSIAVIGASNDPLKRGHQALRALVNEGFAGSVHPVNPREATVCGLAAYPSVGAIGEPVDLALITTPAATVPGLLRECGAHGVATAVVVAVGFGESGAEGRALEGDTVRAAAEAGVRLLGPNTNGALNLPVGLNLVGARGVPRGRVALLCQSGNMALSLFTEAAQHTGIGFSAYVGVGNEADLRYHEFLDFLREDPDTGAVLVYAEGFRDGRDLLRSAAALARVKPVVCQKAGSSEVGQRSALSHTGAVASSPRLARMLLRQAGVIVVERSDELLAVCGAVLSQPPLASSRVAVLTDGGGHGTVAADSLDRLGLEVRELGEDTRRRLREVLPAAASTRNPVDVAGATDRDPGVFEPVLEALLDDPAVDGVLCVGLLGGYGIRFSAELAQAEEQAAQRMARLAADRGKPLVVHSAYAGARPRAHDLLRDAGVPVGGSVETAARAMAALAERGRYLATADERSAFAAPGKPTTAPHGKPALASAAHEDPATAPSAHGRALTEPEGRAYLEHHGVATGQWRQAGDASAAARAAEAFGVPVALKVVSPDITHKSDAGGVVLGVGSPEQAHDAFDGLVDSVRAACPDARIDGVLVSPMAPAGVELMVGAVRDPVFGPVVAVGAGGTAVEVLDDVAFRAAPATARECEEMLDELGIAPLLKGFRGAPTADRPRLVELLMAVASLVAADPGVLELDLNPVIAHPAGVALVDVRVVRAKDAGPRAVEPIAGGEGTGTAPDARDAGARVEAPPTGPGAQRTWAALGTDGGPDGPDGTVGTVGTAGVRDSNRALGAATRLPRGSHEFD